MINRMILILKYIVLNFPFLDGDVPHTPSYGVYFSQLIPFARVCSNVDDFNNRKLVFNRKVIKTRDTRKTNEAKQSALSSPSR